MATVELTDQQVLNLIRQLPPQRKRDVLPALAGDAKPSRDERMQFAQDQLRELCTKRGRDWHSMTDEEREALVDDLIHEDRLCPK